MKKDKGCCNVVEMMLTLGIGRNKAYELLNKEEILAWKDGSKWIIPRESITEYIKNKSHKEKNHERT